MQDAPPQRQRAQCRPGGRGAAELGVGSGAGPGRALGSRRVFRRHSVAATSAAAAASSSPPLPPRPSAGAARGTPGNAAGGVAESCLAGAASSFGCFVHPLLFHGSECRRGRSEGLKTEWGGRDQFIFHSLHQKDSRVPGGTVTAHGDDVTVSEITRREGSTTGLSGRACALVVRVVFPTPLRHAPRRRARLAWPPLRSVINAWEVFCYFNLLNF